MTPLLQFSAKGNLNFLTENEKKLLPILKEAVVLVDKIYKEQENDKYPGANFYPRDISKKEIESEAQINPDILSPFTVVEKDETGGIIAIEYHQKYANLLDPIVRLLSKAAKICKNKDFKKYLDTLASALLNDDYQMADKAWLEVKDSNLDLLIGPYERNLDKLFYIKAAYQAHIGIIDKEKSQIAKGVRDILYTNIGEKPHRIISPSVIDIRLEHNLISSGLIARLYYTEQLIPLDEDTTQRYGSKIINYVSSMDLKFERLIYPIYEAIFERRFKESYSKELLKTGTYYHNLLQSIAKQLHGYKGSRSRLKELLPIFEEANGLVSGVMHSKHLVLKGLMSQKELEALMITNICWIFSEWFVRKDLKGRENLLKGDTLILNFLISQGAIQQKDGISWPNFARMFFEIENLSSVFARFLESASYIEGKEFLDKYLTFKHFDAFEKNLANIKPLKA